jgi:radical SAM superfamily enzyme YgiQ (UPF0313 family)
MKVLLVSANTQLHPYPAYPVGLDYVAGALADRHQVQIVDMNAQGAVAILFDVIEEFAPDVIGLSIRNIDNTDSTHPQGYLSAYRDLIDAIRTRSSSPLVLGGSGFTIFPKEMMRALDADYGVIGEGERMSVLLDAIEGQKEVVSIPGIVTRHSPAVIAPPWEHEIVRRFDPSLPHVRFYLERGGMLNLQTKRGCGFHCIYCTYPHIEGPTYRLFTPQEVARTARDLQEAGAKYFFVTDAAFNSNGVHTLAVAQAFAKAGVNIPWGAFFVPTTPFEGYFQTLAKAGLRHVEFGTESLSDPVLKAYRKPFRVEDVFKAHASAIEAGLHVAHYLLLGGPGENPDTLDETLARVEHLGECVLFLFCGMRIYPQTELYELFRKEGQCGDTRNLLPPTFYRSPLVGSGEILDKVKEKAGGRLNWVIGDGEERVARVISRLHAHGHTGPLWEHLKR